MLSFSPTGFCIDAASSTFATSIVEREATGFVGWPHAFIRNHGGSITSAPYASPIRLECSPSSELPEKLRGYGYKLAELGSAERMLPVAEFVKQRGGTKMTTQQVVPTAVSIFELDLLVR